jgi:hypothetical protein
MNEKELYSIIILFECRVPPVLYDKVINKEIDGGI